MKESKEKVDDVKGGCCNVCGRPCGRLYGSALLVLDISFSTSEQVRLPAEFKHITKRRKRN
jgi:hypothetical protein